ncbi:hypothetical protein [Nonomuraea longicatena]|uniref:DUF1772 domain-containing protein n=1 Tax=Nonomuraea longicatena TaxID=83682 RepID=A0ABN1PF69_9ACTN
MIIRLRIVAYAFLLVICVTASAVLSPFNVGVGRSLWSDPQMLDQVLGQWRTVAALAYTSGSTVGYFCAIIAGRLAARWRTPHPRLAYLAAAILGLGQLGASWAAASPTLVKDLEADERWMQIPLDPGLWHHPTVLVAMVLVFATLLLAARLAFDTAVDPPKRGDMLVAASFALIPTAHLAVPLLPVLIGVGPYH